MIIDSIEADEERDDNNWLANRNTIRFHNLYQILVYLMHNGRTTTPLQTMLGNAVYARDRSKTLTTLLNRLGLCPSYNVVKSSKNLLMA